MWYIVATVIAIFFWDEIWRITRMLVGLAGKTRTDRMEKGCCEGRIFNRPLRMAVAVRYFYPSERREYSNRLDACPIADHSP